MDCLNYASSLLQQRCQAALILKRSAIDFVTGSNRWSWNPTEPLEPLPKPNLDPLCMGSVLLTLNLQTTTTWVRVFPSIAGTDAAPFVGPRRGLFKKFALYWALSWVRSGPSVF